ncbi:hypothetical protein GO755_39290 [Spirosoma sp. HMF4905]|uniref:Uncharacterized protein n=1 Tax=Spirosoma arboris TaxID=2682092 RepID=A0A7K1SQZ3_9BACT|nr:hypothetical protein [Spirosoma arboris]MVM36123.1 hypothetical protein [Spirosoma arboris]
MAKKVVVLNEATGVKFGFEERTVIVSDQMAVADAERIEKDYPGVYCKVVNESEATPVTDKTKAEKAA